MSIQTMEEERVYTVTIKRRTQFVASEWAKERYKGDSDNLCGGICVEDSWPYVMLSHRALYLNSCAWEPEEFETLY